MHNRENNPVLGFDLGTTYSAVSKWIDGSGPRVIQNKTGQNTTQSVMYYNPDNEEIIVGQLAYNRGLVNPENMIIGVKRMMDSNRPLIAGGKAFTPTEVSSHILKRIYNDAQSQYPKGLFNSRGSVVSVPFYFKAHQIESTRKAADLAKINCIGIIQEPIAASLSYALQLSEESIGKDVSQNILVFDLGGGTFDLTLFNLKSNKNTLFFEVLASGGDDRLGGMDFDKCLSEIILHKSNMSLNGLENSQYNKANSMLMDRTIDAKIALSAISEVYVSIPYFLEDKNIELAITRNDFETSIQHYLVKIGGIIESLWAKSGIKATDVDRVIRVGGSSSLPCIQNHLEDTIGANKVWGNLDPSTSISEGAAMYAAYLDDKDFFNKDIIIQTRTSHALGLRTAGNEFNEIIPSNRKTPCAVKKLFTTNEDNLRTLDIEIYQGNGRLVKELTHSHIGTMTINDLPPRPAGELDIEVNFKVNEEQILSVTVNVEDKRKSTVLKYT